MTRGRKPEVRRLVRRLDGSDEAKARLAVFLEAAAGARTAADAAAALGLSERRFHALRNHCLQAALASLEPRPLGRPPRRPEHAAAGQLAALEGQVRTLRLDLRAAQVREEIALAMPHLLRPRRGKRARRGKTRRPGGRSAASGGSAPSGRRRHRRRRAAGRPASGGRGRWSVTSAPTPSPSPAGRRGTAWRTPRYRPCWACPSGRWRAGRRRGGGTGCGRGRAAGRRGAPTASCGRGRWRCWDCWGRAPGWRRCRRCARGWRGASCATCCAATAAPGAAGAGC